jgi:hypothetical protein
VRDVDDGVFAQMIGATVRPGRMPPVRAVNEPPPGADIVKAHRLVRFDEDERPGLQHLRRRAGIILRIGGELGERHVARRGDEFGEACVGDGISVDPEAGDFDAGVPDAPPGTPRRSPS